MTYHEKSTMPNIFAVLNKKKKKSSGTGKRGNNGDHWRNKKKVVKSYNSYVDIVRDLLHKNDYLCSLDCLKKHNITPLNLQSAISKLVQLKVVIYKERFQHKDEKHKRVKYSLKPFENPINDKN